MINLQKGNLFAQNTKVKEAAAKKSDKKVINAPELADKVQRYNELKNLIDANTSELKMIEGDIKVKGKEMFVQEYKASKLRPESFKIKDSTGTTCLMIVMDKYTSVDENKAELLRMNDLLAENVCFKFNPDLVEKYGQTLSELILNSPDIEEEDKGNLISGELSYSVQKGSIDRLLQYESPEAIFELINPIVSLKK